jgi:prepilin peptidase CpaA
VDATSIAHAAALVIAAIAAVTDVRRGEIPNWLTLPPLIVAPILHGVTAGFPAAIASLLGLAACGLVPYILFKKGAGGGGDVKLFAAIGAVVGLGVGIEAELFAFVVAALAALGQLAWRGQLLRTLSNAAFLGLNPILPRRWRRELTPELMTTVRLGAYALLGTAIAIALRLKDAWW